MLDDIKTQLVETWPTQFGESLEGALSIGMIFLLMYLASKPLTMFAGRYAVMCNALLASFLFLTNLYSMNSTPFLMGSVGVFYAYIVCLFAFGSVSLLLNLGEKTANVVHQH
jgi:hypothetical protein